ncbi:MAG: trypsin-like peptidase domain-containing protein [Patescibacteria group bacterium]|nr:trypsin-like peptidase domain-containing protein [Patescibacteria group bacterium]
MNKIFDKKIFVSVLSGVLVGVIIGSAILVPQAGASWLTDLFGGLKLPSLFSAPQNTTSSGAISGTPPINISHLDYQQAVIDAVKKASPAVVSVVISQYVPVVEQCPYNPFSNLPPEFQQFFGSQPQFYAPCDSGKKQLQETGGGSGFIVSSNGLILTNKHVAYDKTASYEVFLNDGRKFPAKILAQDPVQDLAVLKIDATGLPTIDLGDSSNLDLGQTAIAIGNALGEFRNTVSVGVVSGLSRKITASGADFGTETINNVIQTDAAINPGNSGGPLLNLDGQVIGIDVATVQGAQNIGFAIPINQAKKDINSVISTGEIKIPYLGVRYLMVTSDVAKSKNLAYDYGALLESSTSSPAVEPNSPADKIGLKAGDIILEVNGQKIDSDHALVDVINQYSVGDNTDMKVARGKDILNLSATLAQRPNS